MKTNSRTNRRYNLHRVLKKNQIKYNPYKRTVYLNFDTTETPPVLALKNEYNYSVQLEIY
jgi:hypothetical protein